MSKSLIQRQVFSEYFYYALYSEKEKRNEIVCWNHDLTLSPIVFHADDISFPETSHI